MALQQWNEYKSQLTPLIRQERLPDSFIETVHDHFLPLAQCIARLQSEQARPILIGINGAQGTGKSTLALFLEILLTEYLNLPSVGFSIDDLYLTRNVRQQMADTVHPLLATRGVPGTHDLSLGQATIDALMYAEKDETVRIPLFDKATDDRADKAQWRTHLGSAKVVLIEGWCVGALPEMDMVQLHDPINSLEQDADPEGHWRVYVNQQLQQGYQNFFENLDWLVMLKAPSMACVTEWRQLQEKKLALRIFKNQIGVNKTAALSEAEQYQLARTHSEGIMSEAEVARFIMHYERLTQRMLAEMPSRADAVFTIGVDHAITGLRLKEQG